MKAARLVLFLALFLPDEHGLPRQYVEQTLEMMNPFKVRNAPVP